VVRVLPIYGALQLLGTKNGPCQVNNAVHSPMADHRECCQLETGSMHFNMDLAYQTTFSKIVHWPEMALEGVGDHPIFTRKDWPDKRRI